MGEVEAVLDIIDYLRSSGMNASRYIDDPGTADVDSYTKEIWTDLLKHGLGERLWKAAFP